MAQRRKIPPAEGKTYSLFADRDSSDHYYRAIKHLTDRLLQDCSDQRKLLSLIRRRGRLPLPMKVSLSRADRSFMACMRKRVRESLSVYTKGVKEHLKRLPLSDRFDAVLRTPEEGYHFSMIEIELRNRMARHAFRESTYRFALIGHCLRDFRPGCCSVYGDIEEVCTGCTEECLVNIGSVLLERYNIKTYLSVSMDLKGLFKRIQDSHPGAGALGIACIPELVQGMRLCEKLGIPAIGVPLDANRCARWMKECRESSFNLIELEELLR